MSRPWVGIAVAIGNWAALSLLFLFTGADTNDLVLCEIFGGYAVVAMSVAGLVMARHPGAAVLLTLPLMFFTVFSPWFIGLRMLPSTVAAVIVAFGGIQADWRGTL